MSRALSLGFNSLKHPNKILWGVVSGNSWECPFNHPWEVSQAATLISKTAASPQKRRAFEVFQNLESDWSI